MYSRQDDTTYNTYALQLLDEIGPVWNNLNDCLEVIKIHKRVSTELNPDQTGQDLIHYSTHVKMENLYLRRYMSVPVGRETRSYDHSMVEFLNPK